jgi:hypothetical protein
MSHQRAKVLTMPDKRTKKSRVAGAKLVFGRWMVYADATDPRCENGKRPENGPKKARKAKK